MKPKYEVFNINDCYHTSIARFRHKNRRDFPFVVAPTTTALIGHVSKGKAHVKHGIDILGIFSDEAAAQKFATVLNVQERMAN